jgi:RNA polymerase sigma factor (sigma-70 family)
VERVANGRLSARPELGRTPVDGAVDADPVLRAVRALPPRQRAVVALRYYADLSEDEIAATLGCAAGTVKSQLAKAKATLARRLAAEELS